MNEYDSAKMADVLHAAQGMEATEDPEEADVILFNTCSVREKAQEKVFSDLGRVRHLKNSKPDLLIGVGGCVASQEGAAIVQRAPFVDLVFGPQTLHRLPGMIEARRSSGRPQVDISFPEIEKFDDLPPARVAGVSAFVSLMGGCSKYCSSCVVPYTRGEEVSRPLDDVLTEVAELTDQGVKEITLLGQNVNAYRGKAAVEDGGTADLALLLEYLAQMPGLERIRYTTSHPKEFSQRLIDAYSKVAQLVNHVHLPVQSGSDRILAAMKRGYTVLSTNLSYADCAQYGRTFQYRRISLSVFPVRRKRFCRHHEAGDDVGFDASYSFSGSAAARHPCGEPGRCVPQESSSHDCSSCRNS
jgi:tRNA-2-methylthio-N6-dimethylallyladenosine synthase